MNSCQVLSPYAQYRNGVSNALSGKIQVLAARWRLLRKPPGSGLEGDASRPALAREAISSGGSLDLAVMRFSGRDAPD